jgi:hypothetical protein
MDDVKRPVAATQDSELVRRFQAGEVEAFDKLVIRYQDKIYRLTEANLCSGDFSRFQRTEQPPCPPLVRGTTEVCLWFKPQATFTHNFLQCTVRRLIS